MNSSLRGSLLHTGLRLILLWPGADPENADGDGGGMERSPSGCMDGGGLSQSLLKVEYLGIAAVNFACRFADESCEYVIKSVDLLRLEMPVWDAVSPHLRCICP